MTTNEELVRRIKAGEDVQENAARLFKKNYGLIRNTAIGFGSFRDTEDLIQEGFFGLLRAVELWDPEDGALFISYAYYWIKHTMQRYICNCGRLVRVPVDQYGKINQYKRADNSIRVRFGRDPRPEELMELLQISRKQLDDLEKDIAALRIRSISEPIGGEGEEITLGDTLPDESDQMESAVDRIQREELSRVLWGLVDDLPGKHERDVIRTRYRNDLTVRQCGEALGISEKDAKKAEASALRKLRSSRVSRILIPFISESEAYSKGLRSGFWAFKNSGASAQERAVMQLEHNNGPIWKDPIL